MRRCLFLTALISIVPLIGLAQEVETPTVEQLRAALSKPILGGTTTQQEVEAYCAARVLKFPGEDAAERKSPADWQKYISGLREEVLQKVVFRGEAAEWRKFEGKVEWQDTIEGGEGYQIKKLRFEAVPGMWIPALLYEPTKRTGKLPVFLNVNGHDGAGKAAKYKQIRCINLVKRGMLVLNLEWMGMGQLRSAGFAHTKINQLDLCGTSGVATHYLAMKRGLDILLAHENADPKRAGVAGLSGGGWQTIFFSSLEPRVTLANPVAGYSSYLTRIEHYSDLGDSEQTPVDLAATADYAHLTAMLAPRVALLTFNEKDNCCFAAPHALPPLREATRPIYQLLGEAGKLHEHINYDPGNHNFERDNREALYKVIGEHWYANDSSYSASETECADEVKKSNELNVDLPENNLDLEQLALRLAKTLPRGEATVEKVSQVIHLPKKRQVTIDSLDSEQVGKIKVLRNQLRVNQEWSVPVIRFLTPGAERTLLLLGDEGRKELAEQVRWALADGWNVAAMDPFYFGEAKVKNKDWLFAILLSSVGERPLGVQAAQVQMVAQSLKHEGQGKHVRLASVGPRTSLIALVAAATDAEHIDSLELRDSLGSLKEVIEGGGQVSKTPEQFCFGLLETADIAQLAALVAPRPVEFVEPSDRVRKELSGLKGVYQKAGKDFDPLGK